jgi:vitamin B12 transporter
MRRLAPVLSGIALLIIVAPAVVRAEGAASGALAGRVETKDGTPLPGVPLRVVGPSGALTAVTGPAGQYRLAGLDPGTYAVTVPLPGFHLEADARAAVGTKEAHLDLVLVPAPVREHVVVAATRGDAVASTLGISATVLDRERIEEREPSSVLELLSDVPGVTTARTGGIGAQAGAFVRGGEPHFTRILVDGVPVNQPGGLFDSGTALPLELEKVEVVRGAASSLYGTDAIAGVIQLVTRRALPGEAPSVHGEVFAGSFSQWQLQAGTSGQRGRYDWNAGVLRFETDNEVPNNAFAQTAGAASLGARLGDEDTLRVTARVEDSSLGTPGQTLYGPPDLEGRFDRTDVVLGTHLRLVRGAASHEVRVGFATTNQLSRDPVDSGTFVPRYGDAVGAFPVADFVDPLGFQNDTSRLSAGYQAEARVGRRNIVTAGADLEHETGELGSRAGDLLRPSRTNVGAYLQDRLAIGDRFFVTAGGRVERNDSFGTKAVPRAAVAFRAFAGENPTTLKASAGKGIKEPTFFQSFGADFFAQGNPDLRPEKSTTFDAGIEQRLLGHRLRIEATWFDHTYRDQIAYQVVDFTTFQGTYVNLGKTRARGLETEVEAAPAPWIGLTAAYTYLDGEVLVSSSAFDPVYAEGQPLIRRPKHQGSLTLRLGSGRVSGGATVLAVGRRADSDFLGLGLTENPGYARVDARIRGRIARGLEAYLVAENLFDRDYQEALGYPALGRSVRAGLRYRSGAPR